LKVSTDELDWDFLGMDRKWTFPFEPVKQWQWMILSRSFVKELLYNRHALLLLAYMEHTVIPDEMYFSTFAKSGMTEEKTEEVPPTFVLFANSRLNLHQGRHIQIGCQWTPPKKHKEMMIYSFYGR
jgi:Core-2/I-Branching enzyme